jgi:hypothetical protein
MGTVHALALGLCVLFTELACSRERELGGEGPTFGRITLAALLAGLIALLVAAAGLHMCDEGQPLQQWLIPAVCIGFVVAVIRERRRCITLAALLGLAALVMTLHYGALVHGDTYIGRSTPSASMTESQPGRVPERGWHTPLTGLYRR